MASPEASGRGGSDQRSPAHPEPLPSHACWLPSQDIVHLDAFGKRGELLFCLGHEVRSLHHPGYMRPLYNRSNY